MFGADPGQQQLAAGDCRTAQVGCRSDPVGDHPVFTGRQAADPLDPHIPVLRNPHPSAARIEKISKIGDLRFTRRIPNDRLPFGQRSRDHNVFGRADTRERQRHDPAMQPVPNPAVEIAVILPNLDPKPFKCGEMQVDRARPKLASARQRDPRPPAFCDDRPQKDD